jgi:ACR3 family arsenite efflux pump ArsB
LAELLSLIGAGILKALVAIRAGIIIAAFAFIQIAILTSNEAKSTEEPLKSLFIWITFPFGIGAVAAMLLFFVDHARHMFRRNV